jgi:hypothetical protein
MIGCIFPSLEVADSKLNEIINNATETMMNFLMGLYGLEPTDLLQTCWGAFAPLHLS